MAFSISIEGTSVIISMKEAGDIALFDDVKNDILRKEQTVVIDEVCINSDGAIYPIPDGMEMIISNASFNDLLAKGKNELALQNSNESIKTQEDKSSTQTKKCPFCAEDIMAEAIKCRYCGESLTDESTTTKVASCSTCKIQLVTKEIRNNDITGSQILGILMILISLPLLFAIPILGFIFLVLGFIGALSRKGNKTILVCPECGEEGKVL